MPAKSVIEAQYFRLTGAVPTAGATMTAGVNLGCPAPGHITRHTVTGKSFVQLPFGSIYPAADFVNRHSLVEKFNRRPVLNGDLASGTEATREPANPDWEVLGISATSALTTFADGGGITLTTAGASGDVNVITPHLDTSQSGWAATKWNTDDEVVFETTIKTGASVASLKIFAGLKLTNTSVTATDDNQAYFLFDTGNTNSVSAVNFQICTSRAGTDTFVDSGVVVAASTSYHLLLAIDQNRVPYFYINGVLVAYGNGTVSTGVTTTAGQLITDVDLIPYVGVHALTAAAKVLTVRGVAMSKTYND